MDTEKKKDYMYVKINRLWENLFPNFFLLLGLFSLSLYAIVFCNIRQENEKITMNSIASAKAVLLLLINRKILFWIGRLIFRI